MEKAILFIESWSVGITILSREFSDEGAEGNEEREDITGDHVHSVSFCIGLTSTEKKIIKDAQSSSKFSTYLSCNIIS